jgi:hypothetical protein
MYLCPDGKCCTCFFFWVEFAAVRMLYYIDSTLYHFLVAENFIAVYSGNIFFKCRDTKVLRMSQQLDGSAGMGSLPFHV